MNETERITDPSMGSNDLGTETPEELPTGISAGTDTQLFLTAAGGKKHKKNKENDDTKTKEKTGGDETKFLKADETDE
jgi:hypothetical protein